MQIRTRLRTAALAALALAAPASAYDRATTGATQCDAIDAVPARHAIDYTTEVRPLFAANGCVGCHGSDGVEPDLSGANFHELCGLIGVGSQADPSLARIEPGEPRRSLLYVKLACDDAPGFLGRMPPGTPIAIEDQALVRDWIREGAVAPDAECSGIRSDGFESIVRD